LNLKKVIILVGPSYSMCPLNLMWQINSIKEGNDKHGTRNNKFQWSI
jgi:hypothetical protein